MSSEGVVRNLRQTSPTDCLYHKDPASFQTVTTELCKVLAVPRRLRKRVAIATCSCRSGRKALQRDTVPALRVYLAGEGWVGSVLSGIGDDGRASLQYSWSADTLSFIKQVIHDATLHGKESAVRMAAILNMAKKKNFRLLEQEISLNKRQKLCQDNSIGQNPKHEKKQFTTKSFHMMLEKRKRQAGGVSKVVRLPMFGWNVKLLQGQDSIGQNFQKISNLFKPCVIKVDYESTGKAMRNEQQITVLNIWCKEQQLSKLHQMLLIRAMAVQEAETNIRRLKMERRYNQDMKKELTLRKCTELDDPQFVQEERRENFERKIMRDRDQSYSNKRQQLTNTMQCINCYFSLIIVPIQTICNKKKCSPTTSEYEAAGECDESNNFHGQKNQKSGDQCKSSVCRYHPGYEISSVRKWSCCWQEVDNKPMSHEDRAATHNSTGCVRLQAHAWRYRPARKGEQKTRMKSYGQEAESYGHREIRCGKSNERGILFVKGNRRNRNRISLKRSIGRL